MCDLRRLKGKEGIYIQTYNYPNIDMQRTGSLIKKKVAESGYTVRELQEKLGLSCPQPIYRWFKLNDSPKIVHRSTDKGFAERKERIC